jgi:hypothetical protein
MTDHSIGNLVELSFGQIEVLQASPLDPLETKRRASE